MDKEQIKRERHYGRIEMLIEMIKSNEEKIKRTGFGLGFDWKEISNWMDCSESEINDIRDICYLVSEREFVMP